MVVRRASYVCKYVYACMFITCVYIYIYVYTCKYTLKIFLHSLTHYIYMYVYIHTNKQAHTYTHTNTYTHKHTYSERFAVAGCVREAEYLLREARKSISRGILHRIMILKKKIDEVCMYACMYVYIHGCVKRGKALAEAYCTGL